MLQGMSARQADRPDYPVDGLTNLARTAREQFLPLPGADIQFFAIFDVGGAVSEEFNFSVRLQPSIETATHRPPVFPCARSALASDDADLVQLVLEGVANAT